MKIERIEKRESKILYNNQIWNFVATTCTNYERNYSVAIQLMYFKFETSTTNIIVQVMTKTKF